MSPLYGTPPPTKRITSKGNAYTNKEDMSLTNLTPAQRVLRSRMAAYTLHATRDPRLTTARARSAFLARFEDHVDPSRTLSPAERERRVAAAKKAYFTKLAFSSSRARSRSAVSA